MTLVYSGVPGLEVPGGAVPGLAYIPAAPPAVMARGAVAIAAAGPLAAAAVITASGPLAASVTISQPS